MAAAASITAPILAESFDPSYQCHSLSLSGYLDEGTAPALREGLYQCIDRGARDLILDMSGVTGIGSVGIGAFMCAYRKFGEERGRLSFVRLQPPHESILQMTGVLKCLAHFPDEDTARLSLFQCATQVFEPVQENGARLRGWLRSLTTPLQILRTEEDSLEAAASEAFVNATKHASPGKNSLISVRVVTGSAVVIEVQDKGPGFEARQYFAVDPDALHVGARGLGIYVMRHLMDHVEFVAGASGTTASPAGTTVRLVKRLRAPGRAASGGGKKRS